MTAPVAMLTCPDEAHLAAFIDGTLDSEAQQRVIEHLADCAECRDTVLLADELRLAGELPEAGVVPFAPRRSKSRTIVAIAAGLAAAAALVLIFSTPIRERFFGPSPIDELATLSSSMNKRPVEGRLNGDFSHYGSYTVMRGAGDAPEDTDAALNEVQVNGIAADAADNVAKNPSVKNLHALGVAQLFAKQREEAVATLVKAVTKDAGETDIATAIAKCDDAALLTDFTAALLQKGHDATKEAENAALAMKAADRAWTLDRAPQTAWNRALALKKADRPAAEVIAAWEEYRKLDATSPWAEEARVNIEDLKNPID